MSLWSEWYAKHKPEKQAYGRQHAKETYYTKKRIGLCVKSGCKEATQGEAYCQKHKRSSISHHSQPTGEK